MSKFDALNLLKWLHVVSFSLGGGGAVVALLLSGFEDTREDLRGLAATVWRATAAWGFRLAFLVGLGSLTMILYRIGHPGSDLTGPMNPFRNGYYFHLKLVFVLVLLAASEMAPKMLAQGKRGAAMTALFLFLVTTFVVYNKTAFGARSQTLPQPLPIAAR